ncbi:Guanine nucleotide-binding protein, beta subunit like protein [Aduncisulcus paluster]|uniref:Guanine nucleotide-binding protein, beta subunit like protein n=1 Tax=Aduncisulcus paluster TaxID=2918883 RepID=A0ABQ5K4C7_9EUKA|nr:Guanine nucleotide-binding protein, beta subunit like protein [Aduncisulcus paluster]
MNVTGRISLARREADILIEKIRRNRAKAKDSSLRKESEKASLAPLSIHPRRQNLLKYSGPVYSLQWARDGCHIVTAASHSNSFELRVVNALTTNRVASFSLDSDIYTCSYSPSGAYVGCGGIDNNISVFSLSSADSSSSSSTSSTPACILSGHTGYITSVRFLDDQHVISASADQTALLWHVDSRQLIQEFHAHSGIVSCIDIAPDLSTFVSGGYDGTSRIWDMRRGRAVQVFRCSEGREVRSVRFFPSGMCFAVGCDDGTCRLFDIRADRQLCVYGAKDEDSEGKPAPRDSVSTSLSPRVASSVAPPSISSPSISMTSRGMPPSLSSKTFSPAVNSLAFSRRGRMLVACQSSAVTCYDTLFGNEICKLEGHGGLHTCVDIAKDGLAIAVGSKDETVSLWC